MRKYYIGWWVVSAFCIISCIRNLIAYLFSSYGMDWSDFALFFGVLFAFGLIAFYVGYRRFQEYKEYQEDRRIRNEFYKSNTKDSDQ